MKMDSDSIMQVFVAVMNMFSPAITVIVAVVAAGVGLRWVIRIFTK